jgi:hypothetical protein
MKKLIYAALIAAGTVAACNKSADTNATSQVQVRLTDAPFDAEEVNIDLRGVSVLYREDSSWTNLNTTAGIYNLLDYQNGVDTLIATGSIPSTGTIKEIRLVLGNANTIVIDSIVYPLVIPGGSEAGLKVKLGKKTSRPIEDILLDFDANLSIHRTGNNKYMLKPVIKLK